MTSAPVPQIGPAPKPDDLPSTDEVLDTFTGFDEIAVEKAFGTHVEALLRAGKGLTYLRALAFVQELHGGSKHDDAKKRALSLTVKELNGRFREEDDVELPGSESGKDGI